MKAGLNIMLSRTPDHSHTLFFDVIVVLLFSSSFFFQKSKNYNSTALLKQRVQQNIFEKGLSDMSINSRKDGIYFISLNQYLEYILISTMEENLYNLFHNIPLLESFSELS